MLYFSPRFDVLLYLQEVPFGLLGASTQNGAPVGFCSGWGGGGSSNVEGGGCQRGSGFYHGKVRSVHQHGRIEYVLIYSDVGAFSVARFRMTGHKYSSSAFDSISGRKALSRSTFRLLYPPTSEKWGT